MLMLISLIVHFASIRHNHIISHYFIFILYDKIKLNLIYTFNYYNHTDSLR